MQHLAKAACVVSFFVVLSGCINFIGVKGEGMAPIGINELDKIKVGMTEKEVVALFGTPQSFGLDDQGREFIHFENWKVSRTEGAFVVPFIGAISADTSLKGIVFQVYLKDGLVQGTSRYIYQTSSQLKQASE
jgi:hypothetical protein